MILEFLQTGLHTLKNNIKTGRVWVHIQIMLNRSFSSIMVCWLKQIKLLRWAKKGG